MHDHAGKRDRHREHPRAHAAGVAHVDPVGHRAHGAEVGLRRDRAEHAADDERSEQHLQMYGVFHRSPPDGDSTAPAAPSRRSARNVARRIRHGGCGESPRAVCGRHRKRRTPGRPHRPGSRKPSWRNRRRARARAVMMSALVSAMMGVCSVSLPPFDRGLGGEIRERLEGLHVFRPAIGIAGVVHRVRAEIDVRRAAHFGERERERQHDRVARGHVGDRYARLYAGLPARRSMRRSAPTRPCRRGPRSPRDARRRRAPARCARPLRALRDGAVRSRPTGSDTRVPLRARWRASSRNRGPPDRRTTAFRS